MSCTPSIITGKHIHAVTCLPCHDISLIPKLVVQYVPGIMLDTFNPWLRVSLQKTVLHAKVYT